MKNFFIKKFQRIQIDIDGISCCAFFYQFVEKSMNVSFGNFIYVVMAFSEEIMSAMPIENFEILKILLENFAICSL